MLKYQEPIGEVCWDIILPFAKSALKDALSHTANTQDQKIVLFESRDEKLFRFQAVPLPKGHTRIEVYAYQVSRQFQGDWADDNKRLSLLMKATQSGVYDRDLKNNRVWRNTAFYQLLGYPAADIENTSAWWRGLVYPKDLIRVEEHIQSIFENEEPLFRVEYRALDVNNQYKYFLDKGYVEYDQSGEPIRVTGVITDITPRKTAEEHLSESEARFKGVFEHAGIGMLRINLIGGILESNAFVQNMLGYSHVELSGKSIFSLMGHATKLAKKQRFKRSVKAKKPNLQEEEVLLLHKEGREIWGKMNISFIWGDTRLPVYGIAMIEDISDRKSAEQKVKESQERIETINNNIDDGVFRSAMERGVVYANQAFVDMLGYDSADELQEIPTLNLYKDPSQQKYLLEKLAKNGYLRNEEVLLRRKDGSAFWALFNCTSSVKEGGRTFFDGAIADITEQKKAQELLQLQNEELAKINEELDRFVYSASHDLRAPLTSLLGLLEVIRMTKDMDSLHVYFDMMEKSIVKLDTFIRDIVNYSRNTRTQVQSENVDFKELIQDIFDQLKFDAKARSIRHEIDVTQSAPFLCDKARITPVIGNLLSNAFRYHNVMQDDPYVRVQAEVGQSQAIIKVEDNGIGIKPEHLDHIFEMFYRASDHARGSGLGLYIVKETIEKLGGTVSVVSEVNQGTTFTVILHNAEEQ